MFQLNVCQRKLESKAEALLILTRDLGQCRQERDQFKLMAEQVQHRYQALKRQLAGVVRATYHLLIEEPLMPLNTHQKFLLFLSQGNETRCTF